MHLSLSAMISQNPGPFTTAVQGEIMMMNPESGRYYCLDPVGSRIWELAAKPIAVGNVCDELRKEFDVTDERCQKEVLDFLEKLIERGLIKVGDAPAA